MKKLLVGAAALVAMMATGANAQTYQTFSDGSGSSTTYGPDGTYQTFSDGSGGSTTYGPNGFNAQTFSDGSGSSPTYVNPGNRDW
jgi:hypothetical protein